MGFLARLFGGGEKATATATATSQAPTPTTAPPTPATPAVACGAAPVVRQAATVQAAPNGPAASAVGGAPLRDDDVPWEFDVANPDLDLRDPAFNAWKVKRIDRKVARKQGIPVSQLPVPGTLPNETRDRSFTRGYSLAPEEKGIPGGRIQRMFRPMLDD